MFRLVEECAFGFFVCGYDAVDEKRQLALRTTAGRMRNARKWFVVRYLLPSKRTDYSAGHVMFRAWTLEEAMQRLNEPCIQAKIREKFGE